MGRWKYPWGVGDEASTDGYGGLGRGVGVKLLLHCLTVALVTYIR